MKTRTGRKFKCVGLKEDQAVYWKHYYTLGNIYEEVGPKSINSPHVLMVTSDQPFPLYVDASQFELIEPC